MYLRIQSLCRDIRLMSGDHGLRSLRVRVYGLGLRQGTRYKTWTTAWTELNRENIRFND